MRDPVTDYAEIVVAGEIVACVYVRKACERHLWDLERGEFIWDLDEAQLVIDFFPLLRHHKGPMAGQPFVLDPWEEFIVGSVFGWKRKDGTRRYREAYVEVPRKNGKSTLAAGIALFLFILDGEPGAEIYTVATKEAQAKIVWEAAKKMVKNSSLKKKIRTLRNTMHFDRFDAVFRPLGRDSDTEDGLNPSGCVGDEFHAWPDGKMYEVIDSGFGGRDQPLFFLITTAGISRESYCYQRRKHAVFVLDGYAEDYQDNSLFVIIFTIDEDDDPFSPESWKKANPCLGTGKIFDYMEKQAKKAQQTPINRNNFLTKQLDVWIEDASTWLPLARWDRCRRKVDWREFRGFPCWGGMDLASTTDFVSCCWIFDLDAKYYVLPRIWLPEGAIEDNRKQRDKRVLDIFRRWVREGLITLTPGDFIDYDYVQMGIEKDAEIFNVQEIGYDPYNAGNLPNKLEENGISVVSIGQGFKHMNPPAREFERRVLAERIHHDGSPVLRWMLGNVSMRRDPNGNIRPDKDKSHEKIDGIVAMLMGINRALANEGEGESIYESRGVVDV